MLENNRITHITYINVATMAALCKEFDWGEEFINRHKDSLEEGTRLPVVHFAEATLLYAQSKLDEAQSCLDDACFMMP